VGGAAAVLRTTAGRWRALAAAALLALLLVYYALHARLPNLPTWFDVGFVGFVLIPAVFGLMWLALPLGRARGLLLVAIAFAALALVAESGELDVVANFAKLGAACAVAFWFLQFFESALWVALVALMIPFVDAYSVWRGPTRHILDERPEVFTALSFSFPVPGERQALVLWRTPLAGSPRGYDVIRSPGGERNDDLLTDEDGDGDVGWLEGELDADRDYTYRVVAVNGGRHAVSGVARASDTNRGPQNVATTADPRAPTGLEIESVDASAKLGLPDLLFFALFLAAADAFSLRMRTTWFLMVASFGGTLALTYLLYLGGLPALPLLAIAFLVANADLLWRALRERRRARRGVSDPA
jgi:hypothetical protein